MDIRKGNDVNVYFELSKIGVPSAESVKGIRCFFAKDVRSESGDVPVPPSCNPSSYVIHDHMHPGYNVHMPYRSITQHVHREFCVPDNCPPGWHGQTVFVVTDYKIVNIEKDGETVPYLRVAFGGDKQRNGRYNIVLEIVYTGTDDQGRSDVKYTYDYGHQFDLTDQITALSGRIDIWLTDQKDIYTKVEELENDLVQEISRSTQYDEHVETAIQGIHGSIDDLQDETEDLYSKYSDQEDEIGELQDRATELENVVPQEASDQNKLADKDYVNQHISENSATFRGTSAKNLTEQEFLAWANTLEKENNDYVFWDTVDGDSDTIFKRYKYNGQQWLYEYTVTSNNFTPAQWAAINSGLTSTDKQKIDELPNNADLEAQIDNKTINWFTVNNDNGVKITVGQNDMDSSSRLSVLIPNVSDIKAGVMSAEDKGKLDGIASNVSVDSNDALHISNTVSGIYIDAFETTVNSTNGISVSSVNGDISTVADGIISFETNEGAISLTSGEGAVSLTAGTDHAIILTSDTSVNIIVGSTSLQLDESKLQRLAQLLA